jgi:hypothetical protein
MRSLFFFTLLLAGCSSSSGEPIDPCTTVAGTYLLSGERDPSNPGSCPSGVVYQDGSTWRLVASGDPPVYTLPGTTCVVNVTGCELQATCESTSDGVSETVTLRYAFTSEGLSGTEEESFVGPNSACTQTFDITGTKE